MQRTAKIFMNNRSQAVRLPKDFQFSTSEVFIRKQGDEVVLSPRPSDWSAYLASGAVASDEFMEGFEDLPVQERKI
jgi:antitoxin VapB